MPSDVQLILPLGDSLRAGVAPRQGLPLLEVHAGADVRGEYLLGPRGVLEHLAQALSAAAMLRFLCFSPFGDVLRRRAGAQALQSQLRTRNLADNVGEIAGIAVGTLLSDREAVDRGDETVGELGMRGGGQNGAESQHEH